MFETIFIEESISVEELFFALAMALVFGAIFAWLVCCKSRSTRSFGIALALLPTAVTMVIVMVNGNLGVGVAIAGAFGLVRFRSAPGTAKEIAAIFITMAAGLAFGTGYVAYGALFLLIIGLILFGYEWYNHSNKSHEQRDKIVRISIPEVLDYSHAFDDIFEKYTSSWELERVKSTNMGSMFRLSYRICLKSDASEKDFLDAIRTRNGNLEVECHRTDLQQSEL